VGDTHIDTVRWEGFKKYANEMRSGAMIYIASFIQTDSSIQKLMRGRGGFRDTA
jgi:hypothetical protein